MNKVILAGRLTKDPEIRYTQTAKAVTSFTLAVNRRFSKEKDNQQPTADFFPIIVWDKIAEACGNNLLKGSQVLVEGRMQTRSYDAQDGSKRYITEVIAQSVEFMGSRPTDNNLPNNNDNGTVPEVAKDFGKEVQHSEEIPF